MTRAVPSEYQADKLSLKLTSDAKGIIQVECGGDVALHNLLPAHDPLTWFLGTSVYSRPLLLDMSNVNFLDTSGVSWLIGCHHNCCESGGAIVLHSVPPHVSQTLRLLHLDEVLKIARGRTEALALLAKERTKT